jgi:outer membrane lipoprotein-sorting protein
MNRREFTRRLGAAFAAAGMVATPFPALAKPLSLDDVSTYLQGLTTAKGRFTQINPDGSKSFGTFFLHRPGRMRFEYDAPNPALVVAGSGALSIFDKKSNTGPQVFPLKKTPLNVFLERKIDLKNNGMVLDHTVASTYTSVTAQDPEHPEYGRIKLVFTPGPATLREWIITDQSGQNTKIVLGKMETGMKLSSALFNRVFIEQKLNPSND